MLLSRKIGVVIMLYLRPWKVRCEYTWIHYIDGRSTKLRHDMHFLAAVKKLQVGLELRCTITLSIEVLNAPKCVTSLK